MKQKTIGSLFKPKPQVWGLRGDPYLWKDLARVFRDVPLPESPETLRAMLEAAFLALTGYSIDCESSIYVERYGCDNGMSSGQVSPKFWKEKAFTFLMLDYLHIQDQKSK